MKTKPNHKNLKALIALSLSTSVLFASSALAINKPDKDYFSYNSPVDEEPAKKKKIKSKSSALLNNSAVKIYPDAFTRDMHVIAKNNKGKEIDFFVFDLLGTLMQNYRMKARDHFRVSGLSRGVYVYRVFSGDEETVSGKLEIK